jgi:hypothetical protein
MTENEIQAILPVIIAMSLLCCCCLVVIGGGVGAFFFFRNRQKSNVIEGTVIPTMANATHTPPAAATAPEGDLAASFKLPSFETAPPAEAPALENLPGPATPIEADDIRQKLLDLNAPEKPYVVQATGYKLVVAPTAITGYLLEVAFDYVERVARFVETNAHAADAQLKAEVRGVLEANGWTIRE